MSSYARPITNHRGSSQASRPCTQYVLIVGIEFLRLAAEVVIRYFFQVIAMSTNQRERTRTAAAAAVLLRLTNSLFGGGVSNIYLSKPALKEIPGEAKR